MTLEEIVRLFITSLKLNNGSTVDPTAELNSLVIACYQNLPG